MALSLASTVGGLALECCIYNASGPRTGTAALLAEVAASRSGAVLAKSATRLEQSGNPLPRYKEFSLGDDTCRGSINSEGLPNQGIDYYTSNEVIDEIKAVDGQKPYIVSLSGLKLADNLAMLETAAKNPRVAAVELNLACPNIPGKSITAYDFERMEEVLDAIFKSPGYTMLGKRPIGIKLAPYFDFPHFDRVATIINSFPGVKYVVTANSISNALAVDGENECAVIAPKNGFGGLGGGYMKFTALANVKKLRELLRPDIDIVGVGGVATGMDAFELLLCGAVAVQVGTTHWTEGAVCFDRIADELECIMRRKNYTSIDQFVGKLRPYSKPPSGNMTAARGENSSQATIPEAEPSPNKALLAIIAVLVAIILMKYQE